MAKLPAIVHNAIQAAKRIAEDAQTAASGVASDAINTAERFQNKLGIQTDRKELTPVERATIDLAAAKRDVEARKDTLRYINKKHDLLNRYHTETRSGKSSGYTQTEIDLINKMLDDMTRKHGTSWYEKPNYQQFTTPGSDIPMARDWPADVAEKVSAARIERFRPDAQIAALRFKLALQGLMRKLGRTGD